MFEFSNGRPLQEYNKRLAEAERAAQYARSAAAEFAALNPQRSAQEEQQRAESERLQRLDKLVGQANTPSFGVQPKEPPPPEPTFFDRLSITADQALKQAWQAESLADAWFGPRDELISEAVLQRSGAFGTALDNLDTINRALARIAAAVKRLEQLQ